MVSRAKPTFRFVATGLLALVLSWPGAAWADSADSEKNDEHAKTDEHAEKDGHGKKGGHGHSSRLTDEKIPLRPENVPQRPKPLVELGEPFLGTGTLSPGFTLPTGAVWQPALVVFGNLRTSLQTFQPDDGSGRITEWANRLDVFANLALSGSERLVVGIRALDQEGRFTSYFLEHPDPALDGDFRDELNAEIVSLFFEGDFGEIFPDIDRDDFGSTDIGFSVGRQPLLFQEGLLIDDSVDGVGLTRNTLLPRGTSNFRATFFYGWDNLNTSLGAQREGQLYALLTSTDFRRSTVDIDVAYVAADDANGDFLAGGISAVQRIGKMNSSFRALASHAIDEETGVSTDGALLFSELSWVPKYTHDLLYFNAFAAFDEYSPIARGGGGAAGGPLGRAGINFAAVGLGSFNSPLSSRSRDVAGGALGYQKFFDHTRKQLIVELGTRFGLADDIDDAYALTARYQGALGRHCVVVVDGFVSHTDNAFVGDQTPFGGRLELLVKF